MKKNYRFFKGFLSGWAFMLLIGAAALAMRTKIQGAASEKTEYGLPYGNRAEDGN